jgi:hypothetical protein
MPHVSANAVSGLPGANGDWFVGLLFYAAAALF